ncbi:hypothetical protein I3F58_24485 [Streptomyces sp. MUM 203J]|uniref:hypothetical protein n=1 Tax=Streptomyces sp. MUM 203J TaxID=2791990 RepID=UPI001F0436A6|nr:hypothetical protein [Streptomyces sp. MUM 203J]MCH0542659.1 hypothetical protein [Streptomyces sp. MUM 203J]
MESPAENKRTMALALAVLGLLLVGALTVLILFEDDGDGDGASADPPSATGSPDAAGGAANGSGSGDGKAAVNGSSGTAPRPIVSTEELVQAHEVMTAYMAGLSTYSYTDDNASWSKPLLARTTGDPALEQETALPTGKAWDTCVAARCTSQGTATVERDAMIADDLNRGSGKTVSSLVKVTATRTEDGEAGVTETNSWLVTARQTGGPNGWKVSAFSLFGLGNVGASDEAGE